MSDTSKSVNESELPQKNSVKKVFSRAINVGLLAMLGGGTAVAAPMASHSGSRRANRNAVVYVAENSASNLNAEQSTSVVTAKRKAFSSFGKTQKKIQAVKTEPDNAALDYLKTNDLLKTNNSVAADISGEIIGRKVFAHEAAAAHCHLPGGSIYFTSTRAITQNYCQNYLSGTWEAATNKAFVTQAFIVNKTSTTFGVAVKVNQSSTVFAVLLSSSAVAPTSAQVIAGTDGNGVAGVQTLNQAVAGTGTLAFTGLPAGTNYVVYLVARNGSNVSSPVPVSVDSTYEQGIAAAGGASWKFAKVRTNSVGDFYVAYSNNVTGGISFLKWNGAGFSNYASITPAGVGGGITGTGWGNDQNVDYEVDSSGRLYVVFNGFQTQWAASGDPYYGYYNGTTWVFAKIAETGYMIMNTDVFLDSNNKVHVSFEYPVGSVDRISYATNASGSWVMTNIATATNPDGTDEIEDSHTVVDSAGVVTVIYRREDSQNNGQDDYYIASSSNNFATPTLLLNGKGDLKQYRVVGLAVDASNKLHYAYVNSTNKTSFIVTNASGSWVQTPISKGAHADISVMDYQRAGTTDYFVSADSVAGSGYFMSAFNGSTWVDGISFKPRGYINDHFAINKTVDRIMYVTENSGSWISYYHSGTELSYLAPSTPNNVPTDIALTSTSINQSAGANGVVGTLSSTDADSSDNHTYTLVSGVGSTDNASFNISGSSLRLTTPTSLAGGTYSVRVRTTDNAGGTFEKAFTITVVDDAAPSVSSIVLSGSPTAAATSVTFVVAFTESANNVSIDDFVLTSTGTAAGTIASVSPSSGTTINVTVNTISGSGSLRLDLKASTNITDTAGNGNGTNGYVAAFTGGSTQTVAVPTVPSAPTSPVATAGDGQVSVVFTAPGNNGGATITSYTVTASPGGATGTGSSSPIVVTGLTNGTAYTFTVTATNSVGTGSASTATNSVTPQGVQTITFTNPGAQSFGTTPTFSATSTSGLTVAFTSATTGVCTITSGGVITFVSAGTCTINANQAGNAAYTAATQVSRSFTVNAVVPAAPTMGAATAGDTQATISFVAPVSNGGASITGYTVTSNPGGMTGSGSGSPITVTGLTNGVAYTFTVTATNSSGTGSASAASNSITPAATQTITFSNPGAQNFGTTPTLTATSDSGLTPIFTSSTTGVCTITSVGALTFISTGTCTISASQAGNSSYLAATPVSRSFTINPVAPGAPAISNVTPGDTQATITFTPPASSGGASITGYTVTASPGGATATGTGSPITVTGLTNGVNYTFTVTATTSAGTGSASGASGAVIPAASQSITFTDPGAQNFGSLPSLSASASSGLPVSFSSSTTGVCTVNSSGVVVLVGIGTCTIIVSQAGNTNYLPATAVSHSFSVSAVVPGAPTIGVATGGNGQASVVFTPPGFGGGVAITGYTVTASPGGATASGTSSPIVITGLTNGTVYTFTVTATNSVGTGPASVASNSITPVATQTITFNDPGTQNLGVSPTFSATASSGLTVSFSSTTLSVCTITSGGVVTFLTSGTCTIQANQAGNSAYQAAPVVSRSFSVVPVAPGAPTIGLVTASDGQASVEFTAPTNTGSSTITGYTVTSSPGGITATGTSSPIIVTGLTDGVAYTFTVTATSSAGTGTASTASTAVTPKTSQTITFADPGSQTVGTPLALSATASSGLAVTFTSTTPSVCIVALGSVTFISSGTCTVNSDQAGNTVYAAASTISRSFSVGAAPNSIPVITQGSATTVTMSEDGAPNAFSLVLNATDANSGDVLTWSVSTQPMHGSASVASNGGVTYIPVENYNGTDSFVVSVSDGKDTASIQVNLVITPVNDAPVISGIPPTSLNQDAPYSFVPTVVDPDGDTLTFTITNKPAWATFNTATGALTGTPTGANVGTTGDIVISVSDGTVTVPLTSFSIQVVSTADPLAPVLTVPANLQIDATALYTPVTLRQLLRLSNNSTQAELDTGLDLLARDTSGKSCCTTIADGVTADKPLLLPPGRHQVKWTATNQAGIKTTGVQTLDVRPLVSLSKSQIALRGTNTEFRIILNGPSPTYPLTVSYVLDEATTATSAEHTLTSGSATLANSGQLEVAVPVTLKSVTGLSDSQIVVRLTGDINIGAASRHTISIREGNIPPTVTLSLTQNSFPTTIVTPNGGPVTVTAKVTDPNVGDTHTFDWSATGGLPDTDGDPANATRVFDPSSLTGSHQVSVTVADSGGAQVQAQLNFRVQASLPALSPDVDTDGDGISDELEGYGDSDGNGIPDYLDNMRSSNILPQKIVTTDKYLIECDPGVRCGLGLLAMASTTGGVQILDSEVASLGNMKVDPSFKPVGGIFDFAVADLPTAGQAVNIAIPQVAAIPANAVYRKFQKGQWVNFVENADNVIRSAAGNPGYCPPPGSTEWKPGLVEGYYCVQLTITDGGPNDGDGIVNSAVVDPGAVSVAVPPVNPPSLPPVEIKTKGKGGAIDFTLLILMGGLLLMHRRSKMMALGAVLLLAVNTQAADFADKTYLRLDVFKINGSPSETDFNSVLAAKGYGFSLTKYDVSRPGFQVSLGYKWNENLYTELGYLDLGEVKINLMLDGDEHQTAFGKSFAKYYPRTGDGVTLVQGVRLHFNDHWSISPEVGLFAWKEEVEVNGGQFRVGDKSNTDLLVGLHLDYQITTSFGLGLGVRGILFDDDMVSLWGISTRWDF